MQSTMYPVHRRAAVTTMKPAPDQPHTHHDPSNSRGCLLVLLGILSVFQIISVFWVLMQTDISTGSAPLRSMTLSGSLIADGLFGIAWVIASIIVMIRLARRRPYAAAAAGWLLVGLVGYGLLRLVLFAQADYDRGRLPFLLVSAAILLLPLVVYLIRATWQQQGKP